MRQFGGDTITIRSLMLQQTGTFHDVYTRPFQMELDDRSRDLIRDRLMSAGQAHITSKSFRGISAGILAPVAQVDERRDRVIIPDGWDRPRCRFMMSVDVDTRLGETSTYIFQGFSDHLGISAHSGHIDPNMEFFINGYIRVQYAERRTVRGTERFGIVKDSAQVINGKLVYDANSDVTMTRTVDLFTNIQERFYDRGYSEPLTDGRAILNSSVDSIYALRADNLPGQYLSSTIDTYRRNMDMQSFGTGAEDILARTQQELSCNLSLVQDNPVLRRLAQIKGLPSATSFSVRDLGEIDPEVLRPGFIEGGRLEGAAIAQLAHTGGDVSDWRGATTEARWATQASNAMAAIMMSCFHTGFRGTITNMNMDQRIIVQTEDARAVAENMPIEIFERMLDQIEDLFFDISGGGRDDFSVSIDANLYDQTHMFVSVNNSHEQRFFVPSFADSLMSPFYTRDRNHLSSLSSDVENLLGDLSSELSGSASAVIGGI